MPVSRRRIKKRPAPGHRQVHSSSLILHYADAAERNLLAFKREFQQAVRTRQNLPDIKQGLIVFTRFADVYGDLTEWAQSAPEAEWLSRDEEEEDRSTDDEDES